MVEEERIRLMAKLAIYEKNEGRFDSKLDRYYKADYVYVNNWWTRISVAVACFIIIGWIIFYQFNIKQVDIATLDYRLLAAELGGFFVGILILYSLLSSYVYGKRYEESQGRLEQYFNMLEQLDQLNNQNNTEEDKVEDYGANISNSRIDDRLL